MRIRVILLVLAAALTVGILTRPSPASARAGQTPASAAATRLPLLSV
jgi:hypothetical protein